MNNLKLINFIKKSYFIIILFYIFFSKELISLENKILFKLNDNAYTSLDFEMRLRYLDFVGSNQNLSDEIILDDFISANIFYEYFINVNNNNENFNNKIEKIYNDIIEINKKNKKNYIYEINKENILFNIKIDFIRKTILENILNSSLNTLNIPKEEIDLLYKFKLRYLNFSTTNYNEIKKEINNLENLTFENVKSLLENNNIVFFTKEKEINNIDKTNKIIKDNIIANNNYLIIKKNNKISKIFIEKRFETLNGLVAELYSYKSKIELDDNDLICKNLKNINNDPNIINKEYNFSELNNELKDNLININDYVKLNNNKENIYIILCGIKFDKEKLSNFNLNKIINLNASIIEDNFINKYSKIYNLKMINA